MFRSTLSLLFLLTLGCSGNPTAAESVSDDIKRVSYEDSIEDRFDWNMYQRIPKRERQKLAPLQREWLDLINAEMHERRQAYNAKNVVERRALLTETRDKYAQLKKQLLAKIRETGINNWAMTMSDGGLVFGPGLVHRTYRKHIASRDVLPIPGRVEPAEFYKVERRVEDGYLLVYMPDVRTLPDEARAVLAKTEPGQTVFVSMPPGAPNLWAPEGSFASVYNGAMGIGYFELFINEPEYLRITTTRQNEVFEEVIALRQSKLDAQAEMERAEQRREMAKRNRRISELKQQFAEVVYRAMVNRAWKDDSEWSELRIYNSDLKWELVGNSINSSREWGVQVRDWILDADRRRNRVDPYATTEQEGPLQLLNKLAQLEFPLEQLLDDTRVAFVVAGAEPNSESTRWEDNGFSGRFTEKMQRFVDPDWINREYYEDRDMDRATEKARSADALVRYDERSARYLVRTAELPRVKFAAMEMSYWMPGGHPEMRLLAELAVAFERGEVVVFHDDGSDAEIGKDGLAGYLFSVEPENHVTPGYDYEPDERPVQIEFERLRDYMASIRAGREPANLLRVSQEEYFRRRK